MFRKKSSISLARDPLGLFLCGLLVLTACAPKIVKFTPEKGAVGTEVTIEGKRFKDTPGENTVKFSGVTVPTADIPFASTTKIKAKVPTGARTGLISITTSKGTGESKKNFIVEQPTKWTFMVYIDGDNDLEPDAIDDFLEMAAVGSSEKVNIVVQMDRWRGHGYGNWSGTRRFLIQNGDTPSVTPLQDLGEQNMGNQNVLQDFIIWAVTDYPAEHYLLSIWNHGRGWRVLQERLVERAMTARSRGEPDSAVARVVCVDLTDNDVLYMHEVGRALKGAKARIEDRTGTRVKLDVVGFDACLMGMIEVAYEIREYANYMIGSEAGEPLDGWPYDTILNDLVATPALSPKELAELIVVKYDDSYPSSTNVTQAAIDMSEVWDVAIKIDDFTGAATREWDDLEAARADTIVYHSWGDFCWGVDLWDFADEVYNRVRSTQIKTAASELKNAIDDLVIIERHHGPRMDGSHGIAIYFPATRSIFNNDPDHTGYDENNLFMPIEFVKPHNWDEWLQDYYSRIP